MAPSEISPPYYTSSQLKRAGKNLRNKKGRRQEDINILRHYLAWHEQNVQNICQKLRNGLPKEWWVSCRVKQAENICDKLARKPQAKLHNMQDIAGIRIVVPNMEELQGLIHVNKALEYTCAHDPEVNVKRLDYITQCQSSGYRGEHLSVQYTDNSLAPQYVKSYYVEYQFRTRLQHLWATTMEACGAFMGMDLKSGKGDPEWLEFFALVSSAFALEEGCTPVDKHAQMSREELHAAIRDKVQQLNVIDVLRRFQMPTEYTMGSRRAYYSLLVMDVLRNRNIVRHYESKDYRRAYDAYIEEEIRAEQDTERPNYRPFILMLRNDYPSEFDKGATPPIKPPSADTYPNYTASFWAFEMALLSMMEQAEAHTASTFTHRA